MCSLFSEQITLNVVSAFSQIINMTESIRVVMTILTAALGYSIRLFFIYTIKFKPEVNLLTHYHFVNMLFLGGGGGKRSYKLY